MLLTFLAGFGHILHKLHGRERERERELPWISPCFHISVPTFVFPCVFDIWGFHRVSINGGTPKWMVYSLYGKPSINGVSPRSKPDPVLEVHNMGLSENMVSQIYRCIVSFPIKMATTAVYITHIQMQHDTPKSHLLLSYSQLPKKWYPSFPIVPT